MLIRVSLFAIYASLTLSLASDLCMAKESNGPRPVMQAVALDAAPRIDGDVLGDSAWNAATPASGFYQTRPFAGHPATQRTEVYIGYTAHSLYVGVVAYDDNTAGIIVADSRRDSPLADGDSFQMVIDTFRDRQNGFVFGTNPAGIEYDGQISREGSEDGFNLDWDTSWTVQTRISDVGWSAEFEIPFRSLRYGPADMQAWGINFQRNIRRNNEVAYWSPLPRQHGLYRVSEAGSVEALRAPPQRNLKVTPYLLSRQSRGGDLPPGVRRDEEFGFDIKYSLTPSLTLDGTYNTDFAQVEVDEQQVNLDRFSVFLPEKRPFFLENAGQFTVGNAEEVELFFSRRIGIAGDGSPIPIDAGLRLSGRIGSATRVGLLHMQSDAVAGTAPGNGYTVARVSQELPNRSSIGALLVNRSGDGSFLLSEADDENQTYAVDGRWGIGDKLSLETWAARTETPRLSGRDTAFAIKGNYSSATWTSRLNYTEVGADFNPEVGFLRRRNYRRGEAFVLRRIRPDDLWGLHEMRPHASYTGYWNFDGFQESGFLHLDSHFEWRNGIEFHSGINLIHEGVLQPFDLVAGVAVQPGNYDNSEAQLVFITNQGAPLSLSMTTRFGGFFSGERMRLTPTLRYRIGETFSTELSVDYNDVDLRTPDGEFSLTLTRLRLSYSFTPKVLLQALLQYNDIDRVMATNLRFSWLQSANAGLYLVYNEVEDRGLGALPAGRELILKYSRIFDLLN
ncbi:MAG: DUF5916 domain-containing protein [Woeseia sp.]